MTATSRAGTGVPAGVLAIPLVMLSGFAALGQSLWAYVGLDDAIPGDWPYRVYVVLVLAVGVAATLETVSLVLAAMAHAARMERLAALPKQLASYAVGAAVAWMNYDHWSKQNAHGLEWVFAAFSLLSPVMWASWSRAKHQAELREAGLIDDRTVRFSAARWVLWSSETFRALRAAVRVGVTDPRAAVALISVHGDGAAGAVQAADARPEMPQVARWRLWRGVKAEPAAPAAEPVAGPVIEAAAVEQTPTPPAEAPPTPPTVSPEAPPTQPAAPQQPAARPAGAKRQKEHVCSDSCQSRAQIVAAAREMKRTLDGAEPTNAQIAEKLRIAVRSVDRHRPARRVVVQMRTGTEDRTGGR